MARGYSIQQWHGTQADLGKLPADDPLKHEKPIGKCLGGTGFVTWPLRQVDPISANI
jgi:hypothetical protein